MSHVVLVRCAEPMTSGSLESLVRQQMTGRIEGTSAAAHAEPARSSQARAWDALARGLWRMAAEAAADQAAPDRLLWTCAAAPAALLRELVPA